MHSSEIDNLFQRAKEGEKDAYWQLYQEFCRIGNIIVIGTIKNTSNFSGISEEFFDLIDDLFFKTMKEYKPEKGSFSSFMNGVLRRRLVMGIKKELVDLQLYRVNIDFDNIDINSIEHLPDPDQRAMPTQIAIEDFKTKIASPNKYKSQGERTKDRILLLQFAGYTFTEISKILKISYTTLRRIIADIRTDKDITNIKLDLK